MPVAGQLPDQVQDLGDELRVEGARDLVEEQQVRLHRERPDDRDPLLLAAGQPVRVRRAPCRPGRTARAARSPAPRRSARPSPRTLRGASVTLSSTDMCGNRLNAWNTIPIRRRIRSTSTPVRRDLVAVDDDPPGVDRLEQVDAAQERRLAAPRRADQADDLVLGDRRGRCRAAPRAWPNDLWRPSIRRLPVARSPARPSDGHRGRRSRRPPAAPRSRATSQSVEPRQRDRHDHEDQRGREVRREVEERRPDGSATAGRSRRPR